MERGKDIIRYPEDTFHCTCGNRDFIFQGTGCDGFSEIWTNGECTKCSKEWELYDGYHFEIISDDTLTNTIIDSMVASFGLEGIKIPDHVVSQVRDLLKSI